MFVLTNAFKKKAIIEHSDRNTNSKADNLIFVKK